VCVWGDDDENKFVWPKLDCKHPLRGARHRNKQSRTPVLEVSQGSLRGLQFSGVSNYQRSLRGQGFLRGLSGVSQESQIFRGLSGVSQGSLRGLKLSRVS
jgi:hypothetical protein